MAAIRAKYATHVASTLRLAGIADAEGKAARILALEEKMARVHASRIESLEVRNANNPWRRSEFATRAPGLDWNTFFAGAGLDGQPVIIAWHPHAIAGLSALVASEPLDAWKDWLTFHAIDRNAAVLPRAFVDERFAFHGQTLSGTPDISERWKRAVDATDAALGEAVGRLYVERHFPQATRDRARAMVANIVAAFGRRIERLDWMSPATKARAREKLMTLHVGVGYPDTWIDYSALDVVRGDAFGNSQRASLFEYRRSLARLRQPPDKTEWAMTPQTVNAVNLPLQNALNFPAAILQPPYFDAEAPAAVNYGSIGAVIGHEISHSFDDQGALFDAQGRLANWWTKEDFAHFEGSGAQLAAQYDQYTPFPGLHVNGRQTLSENIADLAGLAAAHDAWLMSLHGASPPSADGLDRRAAVLPQLRAELAQQVAGGSPATGDHHRRARAGRVSGSHRAEHRRVVRRVQREAGPAALPLAGGSRARLVSHEAVGRAREGKESGGVLDVVSTPADLARHQGNSPLS